MEPEKKSLEKEAPLGNNHLFKKEMAAFFFGLNPKRRGPARWLRRRRDCGGQTNRRNHQGGREGREQNLGEFVPRKTPENEYPPETWGS